VEARRGRGMTARFLTAGARCQRLRSRRSRVAVSMKPRVVVSDIGIRRPSLDDVFLSLTDHYPAAFPHARASHVRT
jgi:hypothetical protein